MLKIKDNVDLKELKKYGFIYNVGYKAKRDENGEIVRKPRLWHGKLTKKLYVVYEETQGSYTKGINEIMYGNAEDIIIDEKDRIIMIFSNDLIENSNNYDLDTLYDLIKADLVEKVVSNNER